METLVVVAQQDQFHSRNRGRNHGAFGSYHTRDFRDINCRTFQSGSGILPSPNKACSPPVTKQSLSNSPNSPKTPAKHVYSDQNPKHTKRIMKSSSVPIPLDINVKHVDYYSRKDSSLRDSLNDNLFYSELWAGPAYSNSPPPSSLPIPKFSVRPKRTVSLELPSVSVSDIDLFAHVVKSAPPSPTRDHHKSSHREFVNSDDEFATKTLRRILNLDLADE
ncbi:hypothetical protein HanRHA438_Chr04g0188471 [Helianthus annuus]|nr:hypothetical protein HanHA300_Chr04g0146301 [Helianthus annuus]KAJ0589997.1 hypothetical protein HanIR_Chr04g0192551 [Helianthus annuus]KAJ0597880.1 hypothetical protein HanHA89_Chr04g0159681 [Helianthus annuus]KAJ0927930.1 hypothetical protein HanRHA438_Chr04g0188471 [Helianthus annuus]KAJ0932339.1 hypothetical protein HanPSC8_Chr04g0172541 [Helianthus annuus]